MSFKVGGSILGQKKKARKLGLGKKEGSHDFQILSESTVGQKKGKKFRQNRG